MKHNDAHRYRLASHVHVCTNRGDIVLLDLKRDRYSGIDPAAAAYLHERVAGFPAPLPLSAQTHPQPRVASDAELEQGLQELRALGVLEHGGDGPERRAAESGLSQPARALIEGYVDVHTRIGLRDVWRVLASVLTAAILVRWFPLERIVRRVAAAHRAPERPGFDAGRARERIAVFNRLRAWAYTERDACLFSSLAIREYLAREGLFPRLVIGVTTRPFGAHCWLQHEDLVINDTPGNVREFTPILIA